MLRIVDNSHVLAVSIKKAKNFLRIDHSADDQDLCTFIKAATASIEQDLGRSLMTKTFLKQAFIRATNSGYAKIQLPFPPLLSVELVEERTSFKFEPLTQYLISQDKMLPCITLPRTNCLIRVRYKAGYGNKPMHIPPDLRHAILIMVSDMYENRSTDTIIPNNSLLQMLLNPYRVVTPI